MFGCLRPVWRLLRWIFLLTLPFHLMPFICGIFEGVFLSNLTTNTYSRSLENFKANVERVQWMDWFSVPGAPGIHDVAVAPFYVVELRNPMSWWEKLGLERFDVDVNDPVAMDTFPVDRFADLDALYRRVRRREQGKPWHHFVFASGQMLHIDGLFFDHWDEAFNDLLQYHYANPTPMGAEFNYITCPGQFLCDIWMTPGPALLHFTTESPDVFSGEGEGWDMPERQHVPGYEPVFVRIIEFPLEEPEELALLPGVFPSPFNQLRSVTSDPHMWQTFPPYFKQSQLLKRLDDVCFEAEKRTLKQTYGRLSKVEEWVAKKLDLEYSPWPGAMRFLTLLPTFMVKQFSDQAWEFMMGQLERFLGSSREDMSRVERAQQEEGLADGSLVRGEDNFMAQMLRDFIDSQEIDIEGIAKTNPEAQEALDNMWEIVRRKPITGDEDFDDDEAFLARVESDPNAKAMWDFLDTNQEEVGEIMCPDPEADDVVDRVLKLARRKQTEARDKGED